METISKEIIFLEPVLQEKIWGGTKLSRDFNLDSKSDNIGEAWCISAHPNGISKVSSPEKYKGMGLDELYEDYSFLFGGKHQEKFPLLIKIIDAKEKLSVQVHPDNEYGLKHEGELGKTECWYIISAEPNSKIVYGHKAENREQFESMIEEKRWEDLLVEVPVKAGDFFDVPAGTIHAIGEGVVILETQQSSDTTYRVYDYDRKDNLGNTRELHIKQAAEVTTYPAKLNNVEEEKSLEEGGAIIHYLTNEYFSVYKWDVNSSMNIKMHSNYTLCTVISGEGVIEACGKTYNITPATSFIIPYDIEQIIVKGDLEIIASHE